MNFKLKRLDIKVEKAIRMFARYFLCVFIVLISGCATLPEPDFTPDQPHISIVTYNVNFNVIKPQKIVEFLSEVDADVICLQETHKDWEQILNDNLKEKYPYSVFEDFNSDGGGIAVMSRCKLENTHIIEPNNGWFPAIYTNVETSLGSVQLLNVHLRPPISEKRSVCIFALCHTPKIRLREIRDFVKPVDLDKPLVIAGDFNENEKGKAMKWLFNHDFTNSLSLFDKKHKTWIWKVCPLFTIKDRYDHILFNQQLNCTGAGIVNIQASDHRPVLAVFTSNN